MSRVSKRGSRRLGNEQSRLERVRLWRQAAVWAPILWFPLMVTGFAMSRPGIAVMLAIAGLVFAGVCVSVVWSSRCPRCRERFGRSAANFRRIWDDAACQSCGLSLFELRRRDSSSR